MKSRKSVLVSVFLFFIIFWDTSISAGVLFGDALFKWEGSNLSAVSIGLDTSPYKLDLSSLSCSSFVKNVEHSKYMDAMMKYYIDNNRSVACALKDGKAVVFMFEGGSDNYPENDYALLPSNVRNQAIVIVVKKDFSGVSVVAHCDNCSSIPGNPEDTTGEACTGSTTLLDGVYKIRTHNHHGVYGALNVVTEIGYYTPSDNKDGFVNGADGINVHTRSNNVAGEGDWERIYSAGCQNIGSGSNSSNYFNVFMRAVTGIDYDVWIDSQAGKFLLVEPLQDVGCYILDRQLALDGLANVYTKTALDNITVFSAEAKSKVLR